MSSYSESEKFLERAERTIPLGSQTFSKSRTQYSVGASPLFMERARGCETWDIDGNRYIDLVSALASVTFGHNDSSVLKDVRAQLKKGVIFSLPGKLEAEVSELICELVSSAEKVRFGKNGSDATSAAVRLSRAYTGREHIAVCGYHGWQDWFIGSTSRNKGVPSVVSQMTHTFSYNDASSLEKIIDSNPPLACVVIEPMNRVFPKPGFLERIRELTSKHGIVLVFDETITGFRISSGGAQKYFNVSPDLSTFGKGIANGFPLSAVVGQAEIMNQMEEIFFSGTFGGELLSLAAARNVLKRHTKFDVAGQLEETGEKITREVESILNTLGLAPVLTFSGHGSWKFLNWHAYGGYSAAELQNYFLQEMYSNGLLVLGTHNVSLAMKQRHINRISDVYETVLNKIKSEIASSSLRENSVNLPLTPIFNVR